MKTECTAGQLEFHGLGRRAMVGEFNGGKISSDSGGLLLREVKQRKRARDKGCALAGKSTLNRLELTPFDADEASRYKKVVACPEAMDDLLIGHFQEAYGTAPDEIILDVDATDDPLHVHQEGRFFHGLSNCTQI